MSWRTQTVEEALGIRLPSQYAKFLDTYGIHQTFGISVYGIREDLLGFDGPPCVIGATELDRKYYDLPRPFIVIHHTGLEDERIWLDTRDGSVYSMSVDFGFHRIADSFDEWFQRDIIEAQRELEKTRWMYARDDEGKVISPRGKIVEQALNVTIPNDYAWFLNRYGTYKAGPVHIYGISDETEDLDEPTCVIGATKVQRDYYGLPHRFLVLYFHEREEITVCLDTEGEGVYLMEPEVEEEKLADTFDFWFAGVKRDESEEETWEDYEDEDEKD